MRVLKENPMLGTLGIESGVSVKTDTREEPDNDLE